MLFSETNRFMKLRKYLSVERYGWICFERSETDLGITTPVAQLHLTNNFKMVYDLFTERNDMIEI